MDIHQAIDEVMKENEVSRTTLGSAKIKRIMYLCGQVIRFKYSDDSIVDNDINTFCRMDIKATDWKLHEEVFNLSEKVDRASTFDSNLYVYDEDDIKEFIKQLRLHLAIDYPNSEYAPFQKLLGERFK